MILLQCLCIKSRVTKKLYEYSYLNIPTSWYSSPSHYSLFCVLRALHTSWWKHTSPSVMISVISWVWKCCLISLLLLFSFSHLVVSNSLQPHGLQHARPPCPSPSPEVCSSSCPLQNGQNVSYIFTIKCWGKIIGNRISWNRDNSNNSNSY